MKFLVLNAVGSSHSFLGGSTDTLYIVSFWYGLLVLIKVKQYTDDEVKQDIGLLRLVDA